MTFRLLNTSDFYDTVSGKTYPVGDKEYPVWRDLRKDIGYKQEEFVTKNGIELTISGIIRPAKGAASTISTNLAYTKGLTDLILSMNDASKILSQQKETKDYNVLTGLKFERTTYTKETIHKLIDTIDDATMDQLYSYMTETIKEQFRNEPPVNANTFVGFAAIMNNTELSTLVGAMMQAVSAADPTGAMLSGLCDSLSDDVLTITPQNLITLLPVLTTEQRMGVVIGLSQMCSSDAMSAIYDTMNAQLLEMSVNDDNFVQLLQVMDDSQFTQLQEMLYDLAPQTDATIESNLTLLGDAEKAKPSAVHFYPINFESKDEIKDYITAYNETVSETNRLKYTDMVGALMSSVTTIIDAITYVLIAFVSISLVVSSIMIGVITLISVQERTKEIGILRALGASKRNISGLFNAETVLIGLFSGALGVIVTYLLCIPINLILRVLTGIPQLQAFLPVGAAFLLITVSVVFTLIAGVIPSRSAAKKDPVIALRTE
jgi:putative ABC transport system permease protein